MLALEKRRKEKHAPHSRMLEATPTAAAAARNFNASFVNPLELNECRGLKSEEERVDKGGADDETMMKRRRRLGQSTRVPGLFDAPPSSGTVGQPRVEGDLQKVILIARYKGDNPRGSSPARAICNDQYRGLSDGSFFKQWHGHFSLT